VRSKHGYPPKQGLYSPDFETEACGVGFVAKINGEKSYQVNEFLIVLFNTLLIIFSLRYSDCNIYSVFTRLRK